MFNVIFFEDGGTRFFEGSYCEALDYAETYADSVGFVIEEYESEEDYRNNL